jgi:hypothetical protein
MKVEETDKVCDKGGDKGSEWESKGKPQDGMPT